jgi:hypothetical protein
MLSSTAVHTMRPRSSTAPYSRPRRFLNLGDQVLKGGSHSGLMLSQIDRSLPQTGEVGVGEVLRRVGRQDLQREVLG